MRVQDGQVVDDLDARQMAAEDLMLGHGAWPAGVSDERVARAAAVIDGTAVGRKGGKASLEEVADRSAEEAGSVHAAFDELAVLGLAEHREGRWRPTDAGWLCGTSSTARCLDLAP